MAARYAANLPTVHTCDIGTLGGLKVVQPKHHWDGGLFDRIYQPNK